MTCIPCLSDRLQTLFTTTTTADAVAARMAAAAAVLTVQFRFDLGRGGVDVLELTDGKASDHKAQSQTAPLPVRAVRLSDQGCFAIPVFRAVVAAGAHFLNRPTGAPASQVAI